MPAPEGGAVVTLEMDPRHNDVARDNLRGVAPGVLVEVRVGDAAGQLRAMIAAGEEPFDVVFIDADKPQYVEYLRLSLELSRPGTVILADNLIRHGVVLDSATADENAQGARAYDEAIAAHPRSESLILPIIRDKVDGLSISIRQDHSTPTRRTAAVNRGSSRSASNRGSTLSARSSKQRSSQARVSQ